MIEQREIDLYNLYSPLPTVAFLSNSGPAAYQLCCCRLLHGLTGSGRYVPETRPSSPHTVTSSVHSTGTGAHYHPQTPACSLCQHLHQHSHTHAYLNKFCSFRVSPVCVVFAIMQRYHLFFFKFTHIVMNISIT